jgi:hypothetical protein
VSIHRDPLTGHYKYRDRHHYEYGTPKWLRLCDVRAARATGQVRWLRDPEATVWYRRLWFDAGMIEPKPVALPGLPSDATQALIAVAAGFRLLVGLRRLTHPEPTPFTNRFVGPWCGVSVGAGARARNDLVRLGVIHCVGARPTGLLPMPLYQPGVPA